MILLRILAYSRFVEEHRAGLAIAKQFTVAWQGKLSAQGLQFLLIAVHEVPHHKRRRHKEVLQMYQTCSSVIMFIYTAYVKPPGRCSDKILIFSRRFLGMKKNVQIYIAITQTVDLLTLDNFFMKKTQVIVIICRVTKDNNRDPRSTLLTL